MLSIDWTTDNNFFQIIADCKQKTVLTPDERLYDALYQLRDLYGINIQDTSIIAFIAECMEITL